jgi:hypothetical protein
MRVLNLATVGERADVALKAATIVRAAMSTVETGHRAGTVGANKPLGISGAGKSGESKGFGLHLFRPFYSGLVRQIPSSTVIGHGQAKFPSEAIS